MLIFAQGSNADQVFDLLFRVVVVGSCGVVLG